MEVTEEGIKIMEELLRTWSSQDPQKDGEDIVMSDDLSPEAQLDQLRQCVNSFRPQIENNEWLRSVINSL